MLPRGSWGIGYSPHSLDPGLFHCRPSYHPWPTVWEILSHACTYVCYFTSCVHRQGLIFMRQKNFRDHLRPEPIFQHENEGWHAKRKLTSNYAEKRGKKIVSKVMKKYNKRLFIHPMFWFVLSNEYPRHNVMPRPNVRLHVNYAHHKMTQSRKQS